MKKISFIKKILFSIVMFAFFITTVKAFSNNLKEVKVVETNMDISNISINDSKNVDDIIFSKKDDYVVLEFTISNNDEDKYSIENIVDDNTNNNILITYDYSKEKIDKKSDYSFKARLEYKNQLENVKKIDINDLKITIKLTRDDGKEKEIIVNPVTKDSVLYYLMLLILSLIGLILIMVKKKKTLGYPLLILVGIILLPIGIFAFQKYEYDVFIKHIEIKGIMLPYNVNFKVLDEEPITKIVKYGEEITELPEVNVPGYEFIEWQDQDGNKVDEHTIVTGELNVNAKLELIPYTITFDLNGGHYEEGKENLNIYYVNSDDIVLNNPIKERYNFAGWTGSNGDTLQTKVTISKGTTENLSYTANYIARDDTEYKVIHRKQKLTLDGYEEADIDTLRGVTDTIVRPETNNYTGFISPIEQELTITPDGNATITYDYDRKYYTYEVDDNTISSIPEGSYPYETEITITPKDMPGYTFEKWSDNNQDNPRTIILDKDIINLRPIYTPNTNTPYTVIHKFQNEDYATYTEEIENKTGTTDTEVTPGIIIRDGFIEPELQTGVINGDGSLVITYIYNRTRTAILDQGRNVNAKLKKLSGNSPAYENTYDTNIKSIVRSYQEPDISIFTNDNIISSSRSTAPVYAWFDNGTIYYYSDEETIYMNENSSFLFYCLGKLESIDLQGLDTSNVTSMARMFSSCHSLTNLDVSHFNTSNVTNMSEMFSSCSALTSLDLSNFNTSNVTDMNRMFTSCSALISLDVSNWDNTNVTDMSHMFSDCKNLTSLDLSSFYTNNVTTMYNMFCGCSGFASLDLSNFNTSNVTNMGSMFSDCKNLSTLNVSNWNTSNVTDMHSMFFHCRALISLDVSNWDTGNVTNMHGMFYECYGLTSLNVSNWNTGNVKDFSWTFAGCQSLTTLDVSNWDTSNVTNMSLMFIECSGLTSLDVSNWNTGNVTNMGSMFSGCSGLTSLDVSSWNTSNVKDFSSIFAGCQSLTTLNVSNWNTGNVTNMGSMFSGCSGLTSLDVSNWDTSSVTNMSSMVKGCSGLTSLDLSNWDTSNVTNMGSMFEGCSGLTSLDLSNWNTGNVTNMYYMFYRCSGLTSLDVSSWNTSSVTNMYGMFRGCSGLTSLNVSSWNTSNVTNMGSMFSECFGLTSLDISSWNTGNVTSTDNMFRGCSGLTSLNVSNWNTSSVTNMYGMFSDCVELTSLDLSSFDTSNVTNMGYMFSNCYNLDTIYVSNKWNVNSVSSSDHMLYNTNLLVGEAGTTWSNANPIDKTYARIDGGVDNPGYFTYKESPLGASISVFKDMFKGGNKIILIISGIIVILLGLILVLFKHKNKKKS